MSLPVVEIQMSASGLQPVNYSFIVSRRRLLPNAYRSFSRRIANRRILNGCLQQQRSFKLLEKLFCEGQESATGHSPQYKTAPEGAVVVDTLILPVNVCGY